SSLTDLGMIFGAMAAAAASAPFARNPWPPLGSLAAAAVGGLLMGWGARLGFGCNIGAFVGGLASGSLHGWVWFAAALPGCDLGITLRPLFGLSREQSDAPHLRPRLPAGVCRRPGGPTDL